MSNYTLANLFAAYQNVPKSGKARNYAKRGPGRMPYARRKR